MNEFLSRSLDLTIAKEWYRANEIKFTRQQVIWIIENLHLLREGIYPPDPRDSGYTEAPHTRKGRASRSAPFERACDIAAEIEVRLRQTGLDGFLLEAVHCWGKDEAELAAVLGMRLETVFKRANNALRYIAGWRRKAYGYKEFVGHRRVTARC